MFGFEETPERASDEALHAAATMAADAVGDVTPAKRLADELEELEAVRAALAVETDDVAEAMRDARQRRGGDALVRARRACTSPRASASSSPTAAGA